MEIKFKKLDEKALLPIRGTKGSAGIDLVCTGVETGWNEVRQLMLIYHTGLAVEIPEGYVGLLFPRSSICGKSIALTNSVGVIDSDYRGEIKAVFRVTTDVAPALYKEGDRFVQLVIVPVPEFEIIESEELSETERGEGGYGSTDNVESSAATGSDQTESTPNDTESVTQGDDQTATGASGGEANIPEIAK